MVKFTENKKANDEAAVGFNGDFDVKENLYGQLLMTGDGGCNVSAQSLRA